MEEQIILKETKIGRRVGGLRYSDSRLMLHNRLGLGRPLPYPHLTISVPSEEQPTRTCLNGSDLLLRKDLAPLHKPK